MGNSSFKVPESLPHPKFVFENDANSLGSLCFFLLKNDRLAAVDPLLAWLLSAPSNDPTERRSNSFTLKRHNESYSFQFNKQIKLYKEYSLKFTRYCSPL